MSEKPQRYVVRSRVSPIDSEPVMLFGLDDFPAFETIEELAELIREVAVERTEIDVNLHPADLRILFEALKAERSK